MLGGESDPPEVCRAEGTALGIVAIGDNFQRRAMTERLAALVPSFAPVTAIHPSAVVAADATLGPGTVIMPGAVVVSGCRLGRGCLVNTLASLDHDGVMEDYASLAPGAVTAAASTSRPAPPSAWAPGWRNGAGSARTRWWARGRSSSRTCRRRSWPGACQRR